MKGWLYSFHTQLEFSEILFCQASVANLPNLPNLSAHRNESIDLIGVLLGHIYKYDPFKYVKMLNM